MLSPCLFLEDYKSSKFQEPTFNKGLNILKDYLYNNKSNVLKRLQPSPWTEIKIENFYMAGLYFHKNPWGLTQNT